MMFLNCAHQRGFLDGDINDKESKYISPEKVIMNTILSGSAGALATMTLRKKILVSNENFS